MNNLFTRVLLLAALFVLAIVPAAAQDADEPAFPVTITHKFGETTITEAPQRIISLGFTEQDMLLALGVQPVAIRYWYGDETNAIFPWAEDFVEGDNPQVLNMPYGNLNYEAILALQPDLITAVGAGINADEYALLSAIAPTLAQTDEYIDYGTPWQEATKLIGKAIGKSAEAEEVVANVEAQFAEAIANNPEFVGKTVAPIFYYSGTYGFYTSQDIRGRFFTDLGFVIPDELVEIAGESFYANVSTETLELLDQDLVVIVSLQFIDGGLDTLLNDPLFSQLDAVKEGRYIYFSLNGENAIGFSSPLSLPAVLEEAVPQLEAIFSPDGAEETGEAAFPVTLTHKFGETTLDAAPERVVALGFTEQDFLLALGVTPVAVRYWYGDETNAIFPWAQEYVEGDNPLVLNMTYDSLNFETFLGLEPDLISATTAGLSEDVYDLLTQIAPTLPQSGDYVDYGMPWQEVTRSIGAALGKSAEAETVVADVEALFEQARADHPEFADKTVAVVYSYGGDFGIYTDQDPRGRFFANLGFSMPAEYTELAGESFYAAISNERMDLLDQDLIVIVSLQFVDGGREALEASPLFGQLDAVKEGRVLYFSETGENALGFGSPLSLPYALEEALALLAEIFPE